MLTKPGDNYPAIETRPLISPGEPVFFSEKDAYYVHVSHNDALVVTVHIGYCKGLKILVDGRSIINILYGQTLDRMEDTPELAQKLIIPQTQSLLYNFDGSKARSPGMIEFPVCADLFNIITEFCVLDVQSPYNTIFGRPWIHMMRAIPFTRH